MANPQKPVCGICNKPIADGAFVNTVNAGSAYGSGPLLVCDPCMIAAEDGSYVAQYRDRHHPEMKARLTPAP